jgi:hypothetical protein
MPTPPVDTSRFPTGAPAIDYDYDPEEQRELEKLEAEARACVASFRSAVPIADMPLAFAVPPILGLFLVRFARPIERGELTGETEMWVVVGDLPSMVFETEPTPTPADALRLYCAIAQDWAETVVSGGDLAECYPIAVAPTREHAEMLLSRIEYIREEFVPIA